MPTFTDVLVRQHGDQTLLTFRSGLAVYNEVFAHGSLSSLGWNLAGYVSAPDVLPRLDGRARTQSFQLEVGGADLISGWELTGESSERDGETLIHRIELRHERQPVALVVRTELDGTAVLARTLELTNTGSDHLPVSRVAVWSGLLWSAPSMASGLTNPTTAVDVGYMRDSRWGREGDFGWCELPESELVIAARTHRPPYRHPMFVARVRDSGEHFVGQLGWSGGYELAFDYERYDSMHANRLPWLGFRASMDAPAPQIVLAPGESVPTATMHLGGVIGELDDAVDAMTAHIRTSVLPREPERLGHIQGGIGPEQEINTASVLHEIAAHARVGIDTFYIDANWYSEPGGNWFATTGDWEVNPGRFPGGMSEIRDAAHAHGMRFGLWMEPERLGEQSTARRERADLLAVDYAGSRDDGRVDLGDETAAEWVLDQIRAVIGDLQLDFFRIDFNDGYLVEGFWRERGGHQENHYWRYYLGHYRIFAQLREEFPATTFQNCAGGGGRTDLGMVAGFDDTWVTDWQIAPQSFQIINGMTMALPPEFIDRHIGMGQADHVAASHDFQLRIALFGRPTMSWPAPVGATPNQVHEARAKHMLDLYREVIQPLRGQTRIHHHTPADFQGRWGVLERAALDGSASVIGAFRLGTEGPDEITIRPRGIDAGARYAVLFDDEDQTVEIDGSRLVTDGLQVRRGAALSSQLFVLRRL